MTKNVVTCVLFQIYNHNKKFCTLQRFSVSGPLRYKLSSPFLEQMYCRGKKWDQPCCMVQCVSALCSSQAGERAVKIVPQWQRLEKPLEMVDLFEVGMSHPASQHGLPRETHTHMYTHAHTYTQQWGEEVCCSQCHLGAYKLPDVLSVIKVRPGSAWSSPDPTSHLQSSSLNT